MGAFIKRLVSPLAVLSLAASVSLAAISWSASAADLPREGDAERLLTLRKEALSYEHGEGVPKDTARAVKLYCEGARLGDAEAQYSLGWIYANGRGVDRNDALAAYFFDMAAKQGHLPSQKMQRFVGAPSSEIPECLHPPVS